MSELGPFIESMANDGLVLGLLAVFAVAFVILLGMGLLQSRKQLRRRATTGGDQAATDTKKAGAVRTEAQRSLDRLMTYIESTFASGNEKQKRLLRRQLVQAGFYDARAVPVFFAARVALAIVLAFGALVVLPFLKDGMAGTKLWLWAAGLGIAGYMAPSVYLKRRIKQRAIAHRLGFPDFMDLMVVCAEAGLSMEASIDRIARELVDGHPSLAENLYMVSLEMRAGRSFTDALEGLGERLGIEEANMLATLLQQSAELGTSLSQSLRVYSDEMRNKRMARAEEKAYALPAKLVVPLTLFVFPVLIATLMFPVVIKVSIAFGNG
jgi:tight adherence protein C